MPTFSLKPGKETHVACMMRLKSESLQYRDRYTQPGRKLSIATTTLSMSLVTLKDTLHETVHTTSKIMMQLLLRTSAMLLGRRRRAQEQCVSK